MLKKKAGPVHTIRRIYLTIYNAITDLKFIYLTYHTIYMWGSKCNITEKSAS